MLIYIQVVLGLDHSLCQRTFVVKNETCLSQLKPRGDSMRMMSKQSTKSQASRGASELRSPVRSLDNFSPHIWFYFPFGKTVLVYLWPPSPVFSSHRLSDLEAQLP